MTASVQVEPVFVGVKFVCDWQVSDLLNDAHNAQRESEQTAQRCLPSLRQVVMLWAGVAGNLHRNCNLVIVLHATCHLNYPLRADTRHLRGKDSVIGSSTGEGCA